jgi:2-polyprenyl-3-methyl-5-hydroxy-6-metoxy-1,4-benzoquinol methylase
MTTTIEPTETVEAQVEALAERMFGSVCGTIELCTVYLGERLGLYRTLVEHGPATPAELADAAGIAPRYAREWLEQQAVTGWLAVAEPSTEGERRRYAVPPATAEVLCNRDSLAYMAPMALQGAGIFSVLPAVVDAFRTGAGVPYAAYGSDIREGIALGNRAMFVNLMGSWLEGVPGVDERLIRDDTARVADVGCGSGWSSISIAAAYPNVRVDGFDVDDASIADARRNAAAAGVANRVTFEVRDAGSPELAGRYDLVTAFETIHDMAHPVDALRAMRNLVIDGGTVLVVDERAAESFVAPGEPLEQFLYGASVLHCLPVGLADGSHDHPSAGTGTVMRPDTLRAYASEAGFAGIDVLPIENDFWRFYRLEVGP